MKFSKEGESKLARRDRTDLELDLELKRIKLIKKMGGCNGRIII